MNLAERETGSVRQKWEMDADGREGKSGIRGRESSVALEHAHISRFNRGPNHNTEILFYLFDTTFGPFYRY